MAFPSWPRAGVQPYRRELKLNLQIGLIGDYDPGVPAHQAIPRAFDLVSAKWGIVIQHHWIPTPEISDYLRLDGMDGLWCVPASPYQSMEGALLGIRFARETGKPFLGTCGGFQHVIIEYARSVLGWADADHAETAPGASRLVISPLSCELVEKTDKIHLRFGSKLAAAYPSLEVAEGYRCRYGLNPAFRSRLEVGALRISAEDKLGEVRAVELVGHPFFVATLFQPERAALAGKLPPLVELFVHAVAACKSKTSQQSFPTDGV